MAVGADRELVVGHDHGPTEYRYLERRKQWSTCLGRRAVVYYSPTRSHITPVSLICAHLPASPRTQWRSAAPAGPCGAMRRREWYRGEP